ncbi:MAG: TIGR04282 family arsenosugar biosynthesis glycosyltransferase [Trichloromonadaceae bacterium]
MTDFLGEFRPKMRRAVGIFAKQPLPGQVKTRLCPPLNAAEAAVLYRVSLEETVQRLSAGPWTPVLFFAGEASYFQQHFPGQILCPQAGGGLGARLERALQTLLQAGCRSALLVGSDSPDLPLALLDEAFAALEAVDAVVSPAGDGGYVLIGASRHHPELFQQIPWSSDQVLGLTRQRALAAGISLQELSGWEDVDDIDSLRALLRRSPDSATACYARQRLGHWLGKEPNGNSGGYWL